MTKTGEIVISRQVLSSVYRETLLFVILREGRPKNLQMKRIMQGILRFTQDDNAS